MTDDGREPREEAVVSGGAGGDSMTPACWRPCLERLEGELSPQDFNVNIRPLRVVERDGGVILFAPNKYVKEEVNNQFLGQIQELLGERMVRVELVGSMSSSGRNESRRGESPGAKGSFLSLPGLKDEFTFDSFVEGESNQLARAAALQVSENVGNSSYNPLLLYGGVGLGKTHLMHAVGNSIAERHPGLKIVYTFSKRFMEDMVIALQRNDMSSFTRYYLSVNVLLMDDIQFLAKGEKSQEEFFHVFNRLHEAGRQIVLTCDRYPKEIDNLEERLESRFVWGMTAPVDPPDLETRVAILMKKAELARVKLPEEVAFFLGDQIRSNVRELEGALKRVIADAKFKAEAKPGVGPVITLEQVRTSLADLIRIQNRQPGIDDIRKAVADYYNIRMSDLLSKNRSRSVTRPRQVAMALAKELTRHSLPEIGDAFGGRDHTTVLHACRKVEELREESRDIQQDYEKLLRRLTT